MTRAQAMAAYRQRAMEIRAEDQLRRAVAEKARLAEARGLDATRPEGLGHSVPEAPPGP